MHISGTEPSSVIISQKKYFQKLKRDIPNVSKQAKAKWDGVINPQNYDSNNFNTKNFDALKRYNICNFQMGRDQVSAGRSVRCCHATPVANVPWTPLVIL